MTVMSVPSDPQAVALLAHVVSQLHQNVEFLVSQNYISASDASAILAKLPAGATGIDGIPQRPSPGIIKARALWPYNEDPNDLSFSEGDIIEIVSKPNADWWMGKTNGRQALFPSSYVELLDDSPANPSSKPYKPFAAAHHGADTPPATGVNSVGLQQEEKKNKFGKYKGTLAQSAAGGVGFGAGAAIGGGLVRAIF